MSHEEVIQTRGSGSRVCVLGVKARQVERLFGYVAGIKI